jgi:hypothetical protein
MPQLSGLDLICAPTAAMLFAAAGWAWWAKRCRQYRRPRQDRELAMLLWRWHTDLPWGPARTATTVAAVGLVAWSTEVTTTITEAIAWGVGLPLFLSIYAIALTHVTVKRLFWLEWIEPAYEALCHIEQIDLDPEERRPGRRIKVTRDWQWHQQPRISIGGRKRRLPARHHDGINVAFPNNLRRYGTTKDHIEAQLEAVWDLRDVDYKWFDKGNSSYLKILPELVVPKRAPFANPDIRAAIDTALARCPTAPPFMLARGDAPYGVDLDAESPHVLISAGTIGGKSTTIRFIIGALLKADDEAVAVIADKKEHSQRGLAAVPGVVVAREDEEINNALVAVWEEVQRRNKVCRDVPLGESMPLFPRIVVGLEEINVTEKSLNAWWRKTQGTRAGQAPGIYALDNILCMGRAVRTNVILDGQAVTHKSMGSGAGAVNIALRILAEYDPNAWTRLAHGAEWIQPISHKVQPGWCVAIHGREVVEGQRIYITDEQVYGWLMEVDNAGRSKNLPEPLRPELLPALASDFPIRTPQAPDHRLIAVPAETRTPSMQEIQVGDSDVGNDGEVDYVTLRALAEDESIGMSLPALRKASQRPHFPKAVPMPAGYEYSRRAVIAWIEDQPRRRRQARRRPGVVYFIVGGGIPYVNGQVKIGYTARDIEVRVKELGYRPGDVIKLVNVEAPRAGERLPDKDWHERFAPYAVHPEDPWSELFWIRGELAEFLEVVKEVVA